MMYQLKVIMASLVLLFSQTMFAQNLTQTIKGTVLDKSIKSPLIGANVILLSSF